MKFKSLTRKTIFLKKIAQKRLKSAGGIDFLLTTPTPLGATSYSRQPRSQARHIPAGEKRRPPPSDSVGTGRDVMPGAARGTDEKEAAEDGAGKD